MKGQGEDIKRLEREVRRLWQEMAKRPIKARSGSQAALYYIKIIDGQTVYNVGGTTLYGIFNPAVSLTNVPSLYDPDVSTTPGTFTATNGIGRGIIYINGVAQAIPVLVVLDSGSPIQTLLVNGDEVATLASTRSLTVGGDPATTIAAYSPLFL